VPHVAVVNSIVDVGEKLKTMLSSTKITQDNVSKAEKAVKGESFTEYRETTFVSRKIGLPEENLPSFVDILATRHSIGEGQKGELLDVLLMRESDTVFRDFLFNIDSGASFVYAMLCAVRNPSPNGPEMEVSLAYAFSTVHFQLEPDTIITTKQNSFLGFIPWGETQIFSEKARTLRTASKDDFVAYFRYHALLKFHEDGITDKQPELLQSN